MLRELVALKAHEESLRKGRDRVHAKNCEFAEPREPESLHGHRVHIAQNILSAEEISEALMTHHMRRAPAPLAADMFVVKDVTQPPAVQLWCSVLGGAKIASALYFQSGGKNGGCVAHLSPRGVEKYIWVSPRFIGKQKPLVDVLEHFMQLPGCSWRRITVEEFVEKTTSQPRNRMRFVGLVVAEDRTAMPGLLNFVNVYNAREFIEHIRKQDGDVSRSGVCSR